MDDLPVINKKERCSKVVPLMWRFLVVVRQCLGQIHVGSATPWQMLQTCCKHLLISKFLHAYYNVHVKYMYYISTINNVLQEHSILNCCFSAGIYMYHNCANKHHGICIPTEKDMHVFQSECRKLFIIKF